MSEQSSIKLSPRRKIEWTVLLTIFIVLLFVAPRIGRTFSSQAARIAISMSPMLIYFWMIVRQIRHSDEYIRKITLEHIAIASAVAVGFGITYTLLEQEGYPKLSAFWVFPVTTGVWAALHLVDRLRNR